MFSSRTTIRKGFRFHPSVEELLCHYLAKKNQGSTDSQIAHIIPEIDVCKHEPRALPALVFTMAEFLDKETYHSYTQWYFFSPLHYKYSNGTRSNRTTEQGYWKITGKELVIMARGSKVEIGRKRTLTFYQRRGETKPKKTDWVMHEYYRTAKGIQIGDFVLCCLKNKSDRFDHDKDAPFFDGGEPGSVDNQAASNDMITEAEEILAYKELGDAVQIPNGNDDVFNGLQTNCVEGQLDSCNESDSDMIDELFDDPENLDSLFLQCPPPQPQQLPQPHPPQNYYPSTLQSPIYEQLGNVSHSTNVSSDESRKRKCPFEDNYPSRTKKNNISTDDDDELGSNTASNPENQAANEIPEGLVWWDQPQALLSINGGPRDLFQNNNIIELDDLPSSFEDIGSFLAKFSDTIIDRSDRNTEVAHGSVSEAAEALYYCLSPQKKLEPSPGSRQWFKAGSNLKGSFILLDASTLNLKSISFGKSHSSSLTGPCGQCNCSTVANLEAALHRSCCYMAAGISKTY